MKIDFGSVITDLEGKPLIEQGKPLSLGYVCTQALLASFPEETPADEKVKRFKLAQTVHAGGSQEIEIEDLALIKKLVGRAYPPMVVARSYQLIEKTDEPPEGKKLKAV